MEEFENTLITNSSTATNISRITKYGSKMKIGVIEMAPLLCLNVDEFLEPYS